MQLWVSFLSILCISSSNKICKAFPLKVYKQTIYIKVQLNINFHEFCEFVLELHLTEKFCYTHKQDSQTFSKRCQIVFSKSQKVQIYQNFKSKISRGKNKIYTNNISFRSKITNFRRLGTFTTTVLRISFLHFRLYNHIVYP